MFDLRYHLASLAAVFLALAVGILLGVAISDRGLVSRAEESLLQQQVEDLRTELQRERARSQVSGDRREAAESLIERAYPVLMADRLAGRGFAVVFLGPVGGDVRSAVERTLADAGSGGAVRMVALETPVNGDELDGRLAADDELAGAAAGDGDFGALGEALGDELIAGGETPYWAALSSVLVQERAGATALAVDGAVVVHSWHPAPAEGAEGAEQERATATLVEGLLRGLGRSQLPVVGVETTTSPETDIDIYRREGIASVDNVDTLAGRLALALLLAGGQPGHYGLKGSATDGVAPPLGPLATETSAG